jgi:hypothetical protein
MCLVSLLVHTLADIPKNPMMADTMGRICLMMYRIAAEYESMLGTKLNIRSAAFFLAWVGLLTNAQ